MTDADRMTRALSALAASWRLMSDPDLGSLEEDGILAAGTGGQVPYCNQVLVVSEPADPERALRNAMRFFEERGLRFIVQVPYRSIVMKVARDIGLAEGGLLPFMVLNPISTTDWREVDPKLQIERARTPEDVRIINEILGATFDMPMESVMSFALHRFLDDDGVKMFVGRVEGEVVTTSTAVVFGDTAGVFQVGTLEQHRGKGYGEMMTAAAVRAAADVGAKTAFLQASGLGFPIYRRMGFQTVTSHTLFEQPR